MERQENSHDRQQQDSDASLADWYFSNLQHDFDMEWEQTRKLAAEVSRRGLRVEQLAEAMEGRLFVAPEERLTAD